MTKEEAIKTIRELKRETNDSWYEEVYDMAIEALQAHPTLDDVSTAYENGYLQGKFEVQQWIPCSERLPEYADFYLTSTEHNSVYCDFYDGYRFQRTEKVIAWMPLPSPYKGE